MAGLKKILNDLDDPFRLDNLSGKLKIETAHSEILILLNSFKIEEPSRFDFEMVYKILREKFRADGTLSGLSNKVLRHAPWVLLESHSNENRPLADIPGFLQKYLDSISSHPSAKTMAVLVYVFLRHYPISATYFDLIRESLSRMIKSLDCRRGISLQMHCEKYALLDTPKKATTEFLKGSFAFLKIDTFFDQAGLKCICSHGCFVKMAFLILLRHTKDELPKNKNLSEIIARIFDWAILPTGEFRFPDKRKDVAEALLLPFADQDPPEEVIEEITTFVLFHYRDPRLDNSRWIGVDPVAIAVIKKWLVEQTLGDFFKLIEYAIVATDDQRVRWDYRRKFWSAYSKKKFIDEAWVAFGSQMMAKVYSQLGIKEKSYGKITGNYKNDQAVLIMKIGDLTITEWTDIGRYRFWNGNSSEKPPLNKTLYSRTELEFAPDWEGAHLHADKYSWQRKVAKHIRDLTSRFVNQIDYRL